MHSPGAGFTKGLKSCTRHKYWDPDSKIAEYLAEPTLSLSGFHRRAQFESQTQMLRQTESSLKCVNKGLNMSARDICQLAKYQTPLYMQHHHTQKHVMQNTCVHTYPNWRNISLLFEEPNLKKAIFATGRFLIKN